MPATQLSFQDANGNPYVVSIDTTGVLTVTPGPGGSAPYLPVQYPGLSQSGYDLVKSALRLIGVKDPGEDLSAAEGQDGLEVLNQMIDGWQGDRLSIYTVGPNSFPFQPGQQSYTVGPGGDFQMPRPARIELVSVILAGSGIELPIHYSTNVKEWQSVLLKTVATTYPWLCYDSGDFPLRRLQFWPIPAQLNTCVLYAWALLSQFQDLRTKYQFPPNYLEAIRFNLAPRLAPEYGVTPDAMVLKIAMEAKAKIAASNVEVGKLQCDDFLSYSTNTGYTGSDIPPIY